MNGRRSEHPHYTTEQVEQHVADAIEVVKLLDVADDLRAAAFTAACNLLSQKSIQVEQVSPLGLRLPPERPTG